MGKVSANDTAARRILNVTTFERKKMTEIKNQQKCYNSFSCILSVLIILFVVCSIAWDVMVTKPEMRKSIEEIRIEVKGIHEKIDAQFAKDSLTYKYLESTAQQHLSVLKEEQSDNK